MSADGKSPAELESKLREWLATASLSTNMLSRIKDRRDPQVLLRFNSFGDLPLDKALESLEEIQAIEAGGGS
jgi:hypothetical protein